LLKFHTPLKNWYSETDSLTVLQETPGHIRTVLGKGYTRQSLAVVMGTSRMFRKEISMVRNKE